MKYRVAYGTAAVAGVLALLIGALLAYDYNRRLVKDPLDSTSFAALKEMLKQQPANEALKKQIRRLDLHLRREYFRQRAFTAVGAVLLLAAAAVFVLAAKAAVTLRRKLPQPQRQVEIADFESQWTTIARWGVAAVAGALVAVALGLSFTLRSQLPPSVGGDSRRRSAGEQGAIGGRSRLLQTGDLPVDEEAAQAWPQFRGPGGRGVSAYENIPTQWDVPAGKNVRWKTPVPLPGNNSPVVWKNRVFLTGADRKRREVYCFDTADGKLLWAKSVSGESPQGDSPIFADHASMVPGKSGQSPKRPPKVMDDTGYAAPTVAADGRRVFAIFANGDLAGFDFDGNLTWSKSFGIPVNSYGHAASLVMHKNRLLVQFDQGAADDSLSKLYAFDAATGKVVWQVPRPVPNSWTTPIVVRLPSRDLLVTAAYPWVIAYDLRDGAEAWRVKCMPPDTGASPTFADGKVYAANEGTELVAIRPDGQGDVAKTHVLWKGEEGLPDACSVLAGRQCVFLLASYGILTCYDAEKGNVLWDDDFEDDFYASPSLVGNKVYIFARSGKCWVVEPAPTGCKRISENNLGEACVTCPAFQDGCFYIRGAQHLFCIGTPEENGK